MAANRASPESVKDELSRDPDGSVRAAVASSSGAPTGLLATMLNGADEATHRRIAQNPTTALTDLRQLAEDPSSFVRFLVAGNASAPQEALGILANDTDADVKRRVASHENTPCEILRLSLRLNPVGAGQAAFLIGGWWVLGGFRVSLGRPGSGLMDFGGWAGVARCGRS